LKSKLVKRYFAPVSVVILLTAAALAFLNLQGTYTGPPAILDPNFNLWVAGPNGSQLVVWNLEAVKGPSDHVGISKTSLQGKHALELRVFQSGIQSRWTYASISQTLDGARLTELMNMSIGFWALKEECHCDATLFNGTSVILAVETNDGVHTISFIFSDELQGVKSLPDRRIVFLPTPSGVWYFEKLNIANEYRTMRWSTPDELTFSIVLGAAGGAVGWHSAYVSGVALSRDGLQFPLSPQGAITQPFVSDIISRLNP
jgi:hypothetical protein